MIRARIILALLFCFVCSFCGNDFFSLGCHTWRCKAIINRAEKSTENRAARRTTQAIVNSNIVRCCCGKSCKGVRGLEMHQRSCRIIHDLNDELRSDLEDHLFNNTTDISENIADIATSTKDDHSETNDFPELKKGNKSS